MLGNGDRPAKVAIYCRVSSEEQVEANTIQNQVGYATKYAELNGLPIADFYLDDGVSGTIPLGSREQGRRLLEEARAGKFDVVLVYRVDRLARRLKILLDAYEALQAAKVGLRSMTEPIDSTTPIGRFVFQLLGSLAELERETIIERTVLGSNRKAGEGKWLGGIVPYGYCLDYRGHLVVDEEKLPGEDLSEADVVRLCYRLVAEDGYSTYAVADHLNALGILPSYAKDGRLVTRGKRKEHTSGQWLPGRVRNMLAQTTYKGVHYYGKRTQRQRELVERAVPAIVAPDVWDRAQEQIKANHQWGSCKNAKHFYLLRGLIKCGTCGLSYTGGPGSRGGIPYYRCNGKAAYRGKLQGRCPSRSVRADEIEDLVWQDIEEFVKNPGTVLEQLRARLSEGMADRQSLEKALQELARALEKKQREREIILGLFRKEVVTFQEGERELAKIAEEAEALKVQQEILFGRLQSDVAQETGLLDAELLLERLKESVDQADNQTRRELVEALVKEIRIETVGEGRKAQAKAVVTYVFEEAVARTGRGSWRQPA